LQAGLRQRRFLRSSLDHVARNRFDVRGNLAEKCPSFASRDAPVDVEVLRRQINRKIYFFRCRRDEARLQTLPGDWIRGVNGITGALTVAKSDQRTP
jgi:hypothetical protein